MSPRAPTAPTVLQALRQHADPERARHQARYFRTGPGQYGEGDRFLGVTVPQVRSVVRQFRELSLGEAERLLESPWHEARMAAVLLLSAAYPRVDETGKRAIYRLYLRRTDRINSWDLVDVTAPGVVGRHLESRSRKVLYRLIRSENLWERRIALLATAHFIRLGQYGDTMALVAETLSDPEDLIHKASGWMLREVGQRDSGVLRRFLGHHASRMPRTMLRYAIEKLSPIERRRWLVGSRAGATAN